MPSTALRTPILIAVMIAMAHSPTAAAWSATMEVLSSSLVGNPSITFDSDNQPTVAYSRFLTRAGRFVQNVYVRQLLDNQWVQLGGEINIRRQLDAKLPKIAMDGTGMPVVVWYEQIRRNNGRFAVYASRFDGSQWQSLGTVSDFSRSGLSHDLAIDAFGQPVVAFSETSTDGLVVKVKRWDGESWTAVGNQPLGRGYDSSLAIDHRGWITVAWSQDSDDGNRHIVAKRFNGQRWKALGESLNHDLFADAYSPSVAVDPRNGRPFIAWHEAAELGFQVRAASWNHAGRVWGDLGDAVQANTGSGTISMQPSLVVRRPGGVFLAWRNSGSDRVHVQRFAARMSSWVNVGRQPQTSGSSRGHQLSTDADNQLTLIFGESHDLNDGKILIKKR